MGDLADAVWRCPTLAAGYLRRRLNCGIAGPVLSTLCGLAKKPERRERLEPHGRVEPECWGLGRGDTVAPPAHSSSTNTGLPGAARRPMAVNPLVEGTV
ncbi:hypothetical protein [Rhodoferax aquaticus]|uniref:Uncharacterized protein n=1 Tax=Rhodoferax aquaticus TaxID=2527691 RepID=A0A515ESC9_9BURK|nr:hypothetical protein [Rhodoferax aquaticus]QDL55538.1 hypothetical protein EXZ61_15895 [Rhodoferax aquaticus]